VRTFVLFSLALIFGACSEAGISSPKDFDAQMATVRCERTAFCGFIGKSEIAKCQSDAKTSATKYPATYSTQEAVDAKRLAFDSAAAQKCLDAAKAQGCTLDRQLAVSSSCQDLFKPLVAVGGACKSSGECVDGWCDQGPNGNPGCAGTCKANTPTGMACDTSEPHCRTTDYCDSTTKVCTVRAAAGAVCGTSPRCQRGLFCKGWDPTATPEVKGTCKGPGAVGETCEIFFFGNTDCSPALFCDDAQMPPKCAMPLAMGTECSSFTACADPLDCIGLTFDSRTGNVTKKGTCGPYLDIGAMCTNAGETGCPLDSVCDATAKTCTLVGPAGADCSDAGTGGTCGNELYCDGTSKKCTPMVVLGGACTPPPVDMSGFPLGDDPCHDGTCDEMTKVCTLICM
jgi:hypothetical protein